MTRETDSNVTENSGLLNFGQINYDPNSLTKSLDIPVVVLCNGLRVANFSSPHSFTFTDGTVLPACSIERAKLLVLDKLMIEISAVQNTVQFTDVTFRWEMSQVARRELMRLSEVEGYDVLLLPNSVMTSLKEIGLPIGRCRCVCKEEGGSGLNHIDRFYI